MEYWECPTQPKRQRSAQVRSTPAQCRCHTYATPKSQKKVAKRTQKTPLALSKTPIVPQERTQNEPKTNPIKDPKTPIRTQTNPFRLSAAVEVELDEGEPGHGDANAEEPTEGPEESVQLFPLRNGPATTFLRAGAKKKQSPMTDGPYQVQGKPAPAPALVAFRVADRFGSVTPKRARSFRPDDRASHANVHRSRGP